MEATAYSLYVWSATDPNRAKDTPLAKNGEDKGKHDTKCSA